MLAVIEDQQQVSGAQVIEQGLEDRLPRLFAHLYRYGHSLRHQRRIRQGGKLDQPDAIDKGLEQVRGHLQREPGLACATRSGQCQEMGLG